jgi:methionyl aminopeptidase
MWDAIDKAREGNRLGDIGYAVQSCAESEGFSVVREYVGHGIGHAMHEEPNVPNFGKKGQGVRLKRGMVLAIEPMINLGTHETRGPFEDHWTVYTADGAPSAHFEKTVAITDGDPIILTVD